MQVRNLLKTYTKKPYVTITRRGNASIKGALKLAKKLGFHHCYIPDWGGWMTYEQIATDLKFTVHKIKTTDEMIDPYDLFFEPNSVLLIHALAGYHHRLDTERISKMCKKTRTFFINDISGLVGKETVGDLIIGSFGKAKPVDHGEGGFIACLSKIWWESCQVYAHEVENKNELLNKLTNIEQRYTFLYKQRDKIAAQLTKEHPNFKTEFDEFGLVIIVPYETEDEKNKITDFCQNQQVEYTECPRYIRSHKQAISIEIKRLRDE